jgi:pectinesterase
VGQAGNTATTAGAGAGGSGGAAGAGGTAGTRAAAGSATGGAGVVLEGTATRPQLPAAAADDFTVLEYLAQAGPVAAPTVDNWDPTAGVDLTGVTAKYSVAASGGTHTTVQAAVDAAVADGGTERIAIEIAPGTYRELVCVPAAAPPITLYGSGAAADTVIAFDNYAGKAKEATAPANPCNPSLGSTTYGTSGSTTFAAYAGEFQAKNLTFANDFDEAGQSSNVQAVALTAQGDKQIYDSVRMLGNQDTFFAKSPSSDVITRVYVKSSYIEGDTDFIFGRAVLVIDSSQIHFVSTRQGSKGYAIVPSTDARNPFGILVTESQFTADAGTMAGQVHLGRAWDESGKDVATYTGLVATGAYPNGQALVRDSELGAHIRAADPWAEAATTKRPFSSVAGSLPANRLYELANTGPGAAP